MALEWCFDKQLLHQANTVSTAQISRDFIWPLNIHVFVRACDRARVRACARLWTHLHPYTGLEVSRMRRAKGCTTLRPRRLRPPPRGGMEKCCGGTARKSFVGQTARKSFVGRKLFVGLKRGAPVAPRITARQNILWPPRKRGGWSLWFPPDPGWNKQGTEIPRPSSPTGTAAAECPEEEEPPAWEAPTA